MKYLWSLFDCDYWGVRHLYISLRCGLSFTDIWLVNPPCQYSLTETSGQLSKRALNLLQPYYYCVRIVYITKYVYLFMDWTCEASRSIVRVQKKRTSEVSLGSCTLPPRCPWRGSSIFNSLQTIKIVQTAYRYCKEIKKTNYQLTIKYNSSKTFLCAILHSISESKNYIVTSAQVIVWISIPITYTCIF